MMRLNGLNTLILLVALALPTGALGASAATDPAQFVRGLGREVLDIIRAPGLDERERRRRYQQIFERNFAVDRMAQLALGRHWRRLSEPDRGRYLRIFRDYVIRLYADRFTEYSGEKFSVIERTAKAGDQWRIPARIVSPNDADVDLTFVLERPKDQFTIVDVAVEGVSLLITKRSEFDSVINRKGIGGFLDDLEKLTEKMAGMGKKIRSGIWPYALASSVFYGAAR